MKRIPFPRRLITHDFKRPHSKAEEPDCLFRRNPPSIMIATQSLGGGRGVLFRGCKFFDFLLSFFSFLAPPVQPFYGRPEMEESIVFLPSHFEMFPEIEVR